MGVKRSGLVCGCDCAIANYLQVATRTPRPLPGGGEVPLPVLVGSPSTSPSLASRPLTRIDVCLAERLTAPSMGICQNQRRGAATTSTSVTRDIVPATAMPVSGQTPRTSGRNADPAEDCDLQSEAHEAALAHGPRSSESALAIPTLPKVTTGWHGGHSHHASRRSRCRRRKGYRHEPSMRAERVPPTSPSTRRVRPTATHGEREGSASKFRTSWRLENGLKTIREPPGNR